MTRGTAASRRITAAQYRRAQVAVQRAADAFQVNQMKRTFLNTVKSTEFYSTARQWWDQWNAARRTLSPTMFVAFNAMILQVIYSWWSDYASMIDPAIHASHPDLGALVNASSAFEAPQMKSYFDIPSDVARYGRSALGYNMKAKSRRPRR